MWQYAELHARSHGSKLTAQLIVVPPSPPELGDKTGETRPLDYNRLGETMRDMMDAGWEPVGICTTNRGDSLQGDAMYEVIRTFKRPMLTQVR